MTEVPSDANSTTMVDSTSTPVDGASLAAQSARTQSMLRAQKLFDQALNWIKVGGSFDKIHGLLTESYTLSQQVHGEVDLKTARVAWQLASLLLTRGRIQEAEHLLLTVQGVREQLLPETSDELYDVYTDLSYVHLFRAQHAGASSTAPSGTKVAKTTAVFDPAHEYETAMSFALRARNIVMKNASSSTSERFHYRLCLISSRIGGIQRAQGQLELARASYEEAYTTSSHLQLDLEKNVKIHVHSILELAAILTQIQQMNINKKNIKKSIKKTDSMPPSASSNTSATAPTTAASTPSVASPHDATALYIRAIALLKEHNLIELPFMAQAQAGLALLLMAVAEALHEDQKVIDAKTAAAKQLPSSTDATTTTTTTTASTTSTTSSSLSADEDAAAASSPTLSPALTSKERRTKIQDLLKEAVTLTTEAMQLYQKIHGPDSPDVATMCYNLGSFHSRLGSNSEARTFLSRALAIRTNLLGTQHDSVVKVRDDLRKLEKRSSTTLSSDRYTSSSTAPLTARAASIAKRSTMPTSSSTASSSSVTPPLTNTARKRTPTTLAAAGATITTTPPPTVNRRTTAPQPLTSSTTATAATSTTPSSSKPVTARVRTKSTPISGNILTASQVAHLAATKRAR